MLAGLSRWHAGGDAGAPGTPGAVIVEVTAADAAPLRLPLTDRQAAELVARLGGGVGPDDWRRWGGADAAALLADRLGDGVPAATPADALITLRAGDGTGEPCTVEVPLGRLTELARALEYVLTGSTELSTVARHSHFQVGDRVVIRNVARGRAAGGRPGEVVRVHIAYNSAGTEPEFWYDVVLDGPRSGYPQTFLAGDLVAEDDRDPGGTSR